MNMAMLLPLHTIQYYKQKHLRVFPKELCVSVVAKILDGNSVSPELCNCRGFNTFYFPNEILSSGDDIDYYKVMRNFLNYFRFKVR